MYLVLRVDTPDMGTVELWSIGSKFVCMNVKNFQILGFFDTNRSVGAKPQKKCANIIADSATFKQYGDFDTWVGRWSN